MGRTPTFDRTQVVRTARSVFWRDGFDNASIPDLETATGLNRSSIYNAFESKRGLFDAAVQSYLAEVIRPRLRPLVADAVAPDALDDYLAALGRAFGSGGPALNGCLLINSAGAPIAQDPAVRQVIADYRDELHHAIGRGVDAARRDASNTHRGHLADIVTGLVIGAFSLVRIAPERAIALVATARDAVKLAVPG